MNITKVGFFILLILGALIASGCTGVDLKSGAFKDAVEGIVEVKLASPEFTSTIDSKVSAYISQNVEADISGKVTAYIEPNVDLQNKMIADVTSKAELTAKAQADLSNKVNQSLKDNKQNGLVNIANVSGNIPLIAVSILGMLLLLAIFLWRRNVSAVKHLALHLNKVCDFRTRRTIRQDACKKPCYSIVHKAINP